MEKITDEIFPKSLVAHQTQGLGSDRRTESVSQSVRRRHYRDNDSKSVSHSLSVWTGPDRGNTKEDSGKKRIETDSPYQYIIMESNS